jgi:hypothetical protein
VTDPVAVLKNSEEVIPSTVDIRADVLIYPDLPNP